MAGLYRQYDALVARWADDALRGLDTEHAVLLVARASEALWARAKGPLSERMLEVVGERIRHTLAPQFPWMASVELGHLDSWRALGSRAGTLSRPEMIDGLKRMLVEFLSLTGELTGDLLAPALERELERVRP